MFKPLTRTGTGAVATVTGVGFEPDVVIAKERVSAALLGPIDFDRLRGAQNYLLTPSTSMEAEATNALTGFDIMDGVVLGVDSDTGAINYTGIPYINWFFRRAPGFFDVVCFTSAGGVTPHSLTVAPELVIYKPRSLGAWYVFAAANGFGEMNSTVAWGGMGNGSGLGSNLANASASSIHAGFNLYGSGVNMVAYLFASLPGVSKVGSYTGNGTSLSVECGFSTGARFILVKLIDDVGDWFIWDTARGIVAANDPHLSLNTTAAEVTTDDSVDPYAGGFIVNQNTATNINITGKRYIFLAIA